MLLFAVAFLVLPIDSSVLTHTRYANILTKRKSLTEVADAFYDILYDPTKSKNKRGLHTCN